MPAIHIVIRQLQAVVSQAEDLIERLDPEAYVSVADGQARSGVGAHFRHVLDFVDVFLDGLPGRRIDYDRRARDGRSEADREVALARLAELSERLARLEAAESGLRRDTAVEVRSDVPEGTPADEGWSPSSVGRELTFLVSHTVHHFAVIGLVLRGLGVDPGSEFGVAPSTLAFWKEAERCAPLAG